MNYQDEVVCPKCGSNQLSANKKGFSGQKAVAGVVLTGGIGLLAGTIGSNKIKITCLNCGNQFNPGEKRIVSHNEQPQRSLASILIMAVLAFLFFIGIIYFVNDDKPATPPNTPIETTYKTPQTTSALKVTHSPNLTYTIINKDRGTDNLIKTMYVYVPNLNNIEKINDEIKSSYESSDATDFQVFYFNNKKIATNYESLLFNGNISDDESERISSHVIAKYEYSDITKIDQLYTGPHSDDN